MSKKQDQISEVEKTVAEQIWDEIKNKSIEMFALPDQKVHQYCKQIKIEPSKLYLTTTATSTLPSLEAALGAKYTVELLDKYVVVSRATTSLTKK